jgi:hypothetical protein
MMLMLLTLGTACCGQFTQVLSCFPFELSNTSAFFGFLKTIFPKYAYFRKQGSSYPYGITKY